MDHPNFISTEFTKKIVPAQQTAQAIYSLLRKSHAPDICYVISSNEEIDACQFPALDALRKTIGKGFGTILSFVPGKLAYFENEDGDMRFILEK